MHIRITWGKVKPGSWADYEAAYKQAVVHHEREVPGLRGRLLIHDADDPDSGGTLSLWESAQAARDYEKGDVRSVTITQLEPFFSGEFVSHTCDVVFSSGALDVNRALPA